MGYFRTPGEACTAWMNYTPCMICALHQSLLLITQRQGLTEILQTSFLKTPFLRQLRLFMSGDSFIGIILWFSIPQLQEIIDTPCPIVQGFRPSAE